MTDSKLTKRFQSIRGIIATMLIAAALPTAAQQLRVLDNITDTNGNVYSLWAMAISTNHRYVAGQAQSQSTGVAGLFVYDLETGDYVVEEGIDELGGDLRAVNDEGVAAGFNPNAVTLAIDGSRTELETPDGYESGARDLSEDGSVVVGCYWNSSDYVPHACVWKDGEMIALPEPTEEEMGFSFPGTSANYCNSDASVIAGYIYDNLITFPLIVWYLQDDGTYVCDPVCKEYFGLYEENTDKPYEMFRASNISRNGKYAAVTLAEPYGESRMARYDLETGELEEFVADGTGNVEAGTSTECASVANDGTLTGWFLSYSLFSSLRTACIWWAGADEPELLSEKYPEYTQLATYDEVGYNLLYDITPDAKTALGFAYDENYYYVSYVIDFEDTATGISTVADACDEAAETARYTLSGTRVAAPVKGLNIVKKADGSVTKVFVK